jgi:leucyl-tRNA synthetase
MEMFGEDFERYTEQDSAPTAPRQPNPTPAKALEAVDPSKAKKGKLNAKSTGLTYQFQILELVGVPRDEIKKFAEPQHWLTYFPPIAKTDLNAMGARVDWRRQFVTSKSCISFTLPLAPLTSLQPTPIPTMMVSSDGR